MEHITGQDYVYPEGQPELHDETLLYNFLETRAGISTSPTHNIFPRKVALESKDNA